MLVQGTGHEFEHQTLEIDYGTLSSLAGNNSFPKAPTNRTALTFYSISGHLRPSTSGDFGYSE